MQIVNFGHFTRQNDTGVLFYKNGDGQDWYEMRKALTTWTDAGEFVSAVYGTWLTLTPSGVVVHVEFDPSRLVPDDKIILGVDAVHTSITPGMIYSNGTIAPPPPLTADEKRAAMPPVTRRQLQLTLVRNGKSLAAIDATIAALPAGPVRDEAMIEWNAAGHFNRLHPTLLAIAAALNLTPEDVDTMWESALTL